MLPTTLGFPGNMIHCSVLSFFPRVTATMISKHWEYGHNNLFKNIIENMK